MKSNTFFTTTICILLLFGSAQVAKYLFAGQWQFHHIGTLRILATGVSSVLWAAFAFWGYNRLTSVEYLLLVIFTAGGISNFVDVTTIGVGINYFKFYTNIDYNTGMAYGWYFNLADVFIYGSLAIYLLGTLITIIFSKGKMVRIHI